MDSPLGISLQTTVDNFSYQVSTESDSRFWFRLERQMDRDIITDFLIGSFPKQQGGTLLSQCYRALDLIPRSLIVFRDILPGSEKTPAALEQARDFFLAAGKSLMIEFGMENIEHLIEQSRGKTNLLLIGSLRSPGKLESKG
jgi:hypothetical protein